MTLYRNLYILFVAIGLNSCYKEAVIPNSLLPAYCRISQISTINFNKQDSLDYQYDRLGNRTIERFNNAIKRVFKFDSNGLYITSQQMDGVTLAYQYESLGTTKRISRISGGAFSYVYTYEGDNIKTYVSTEPAGTRTYSFTNGKLTGLTVTPDQLPMI
ncbi:hypothetical protein GO730_28395 [Spirosoma sp. HMF3257]|uniref:RHS repeat protein n=1 Tax=Spirosoma telluris TaxID=2183553 RepID=A0A327NNZ5_9BACT|nr:hypothetical protein [Spirosoma telluris]RAI77121.1 hypothetical protein HMF3257_28335 [Spirosoma telluris]